MSQEDRFEVYLKELAKLFDEKGLFEPARTVRRILKRYLQFRSQGDDQTPGGFTPVQVVKKGKQGNDERKHD